MAKPFNVDYEYFFYIYNEIWEGLMESGIWKK